MQNDMDNYLRDLARSCAKEAFEKAREKASRSDFMGINSGKVAKIVVNNRKGADDMLMSLAAKAESAASLTDLIPIHKAVYGILRQSIVRSRGPISVRTSTGCSVLTASRN